MRIYLAAVGQLKNGAERDLFDRYADRFAHQGQLVRIGPMTVVEIPESRARSADQRRKAEALTLLQKVPDDSLLVALDETAKCLTSREFANFLQDRREAGTRTLALLLGGADGHGDAILRKAGRKLSLGRMTLPHGLARIVIAEQLYRAMTILSGHPYHRE